MPAHVKTITKAAQRGAADGYSDVNPDAVVKLAANSADKSTDNSADKSTAKSARACNIAIIGPGLIGCFLSALLAQPNAALSMQVYGRRLVANKSIQASWLDLHGQPQQSLPVDCCVSTDWQTLKAADLVLLTTKATALEAVCQQLPTLLPKEIPVVLCQNGLGITALVRQYLPNPIYQLIVPFNVALSNGVSSVRGKSTGHAAGANTDINTTDCYTQVSGGNLICQQPSPAHPQLQAVLDVLSRLGVPIESVADIRPVVYGKLLLNLNNALNAISDLPLKSQLQQRHWRLRLANLMQEWLACCRAEQVKPAQLTKVPPALLPWVLRLPDWLFNRLAASMLRIDPQARLSMWHDLQQQQPSEISFLNGAVVAACTQHGLAAPANQQVVQLIKQLEQQRSTLSERPKHF